MKAKHQRLALLGAALTALGAAAAISFSALGQTVTYFYAPSDVAKEPPPVGEAIRLGGLVEAGSVVRDDKHLTFRVTDNLKVSRVSYAGLTPDLFREGQGVIAEGRFDASGLFVADTVLAKHDENYMPPEVAGSLHKVGKVG
jgi:cytochrome c-type biogenesis protein CcmE